MLDELKHLTSEDRAKLAETVRAQLESERSEASGNSELIADIDLKLAALNDTYGIIS